MRTITRHVRFADSTGHWTHTLCHAPCTTEDVYRRDALLAPNFPDFAAQLCQLCVRTLIEQARAHRPQTEERSTP